MPDSFPLSDRLLRSLMGTFTHDLRNPLSAIVSNLDFASRMAAQSNLDPDLVEALTDSVAACDLFRRILANLDVVAAAEPAARVETAPIGPLVTEAAKRCAAQADQAGLTITVIGGDAPLKAQVDKLNFALGVENLVANSVTHAPQGSEVTVTIEGTAEQVMVHLADRGPAIPAELHEVAVSPTGQTASGRQNGSRYARGVSLLAAHLIAQLCGGSLSLGADEGGSRFTLTVPRSTDG